VRGNAGAEISRGWRLALACATALVVLADLGVAAAAVRHVGQWDFVCFWLYGHAVAAHANVYAPQTFAQLALPVPVDMAFRREILGVGFPYPPPSIVLFAPLGALANLRLASLLWMTLQLGALGGAIALLARGAGAARGLAIAAFALALPSTAIGLGLQQTTPLALLAVVVAGGGAPRGGIARGVAAGLAVIVKPVLVVVPLWLALRRRGSAFLAALVTLALATATALPLIGPGGLASYRAENPAARLPAGVFSESGAASLYAALLRARGDVGSFAGPLHDATFVTLAAVATLVTLGLTLRAQAAGGDLTLGLWIALGLALYPGTGAAYALLLVPSAVALARRLPAARGALAAAIAFALVTLTAAEGPGSFAAIAVLWLTLATTLGLRLRPARRPVPAV